MNTTGFPSPAQGYEQNTFDFNRLLISHPAATFAMRYEGSELYRDGIHRNDILIVDSSLLPAKDKLAVITEDSQFRCVRLETGGSSVENHGFQYTDDRGKSHPVGHIFGIVSAVVRLV